MADIIPGVDLEDEAYAAFAEAFQNRAPAGPRAHLAGDPFDVPEPATQIVGGGDGTPTSPQGDPAPAAEAPVPAAPASTPDPAAVPAPDTSPPPVPPSTAPQPVTINGRDYDYATIEQYTNIVNRLAALPIEQRQAIDTLISTGQFPMQGAAAPPTAPVEDDHYDEYVDPRAAEDIRSLRAQLDALKQSTASLAQQSNQTELERLTEVVNGAISAFGTSHSLTAEECNRLATEAARLQIGPALLDAHNGDYHASTLEALEVAMYHLPDFRQRALEAQVTAAVDAKVAEQATRQTRKEKAGALAGSPTGSIPRETPAPRPTNRAEQIEAIAAMVREAQSNGVPS